MCATATLRITHLRKHFSNQCGWSRCQCVSSYSMHLPMPASWDQMLQLIAWHSASILWTLGCWVHLANVSQL